MLKNFTHGYGILPARDVLVKPGDIVKWDELE